MCKSNIFYAKYQNIIFKKINSEFWSISTSHMNLTSKFRHCLGLCTKFSAPILSFAKFHTILVLGFLSSKTSAFSSKISLCQSLYTKMFHQFFSSKTIYLIYFLMVYDFFLITIIKNNSVTITKITARIYILNKVSS